MTITGFKKTGWFKASRSNGVGACVEVSFEGGAVRVRDTKWVPLAGVAQPTLTVDAVLWDAFARSFETGVPVTDAPSVRRFEDGSVVVTDGIVTLSFTPVETAIFLIGVHAGEFDLVAV